MELKKGQKYMVSFLAEYSSV